jgi:hypothetical protein
MVFDQHLGSTNNMTTTEQQPNKQARPSINTRVDGTPLSST